MTLADLSHKPYDLLVIGGSAEGLFAAADAASRGLSVALIDRADFGGGCRPGQGTLGGGLQSFREGRLGRTRREVTERRTWARLAPHLLRPLPFLAGTYRWTGRSRMMAKAGFRAYDMLGRHRNAKVSPELHLPKARLESAAATRRLFPGIAESGLTGGAVWYDYQARHPNRLIWTLALSARQQGATLVNYVEAIGAHRDGPNGRVTGATVRDPLSGEERHIRASATLVVTSGGPSTLLAAMGVSAPPGPRLRTMDVLLNRPARDIALVAPSPSGRLLTAMPWHDHLLVGTHHSKRPVETEASPPPDEAIEAFLVELNEAFPHLSATRRDIRLLSHGFVPAEMRGDRIERRREPLVARHGRDGAAGVVSLVGFEITTARWAAECAVDAVCLELGRNGGRCRTQELELPHAGVADVEGRLVETLREIHVTLDREVVDHLIGWYGTEASDVARYAATEGLLTRLSSDGPILSGEVAYAVEHEAATRLSDVVLRRTPLGAVGQPNPEAVARAAGIMGDRLGWAATRRAAETADLESTYRALTVSPP